MSSNITRWTICLLLILSVLPTVFSLYFYLEGSEQKCFTEELPKETVVIGKKKRMLLVFERFKLYVVYSVPLLTMLTLMPFHS